MDLRSLSKLVVNLKKEEIQTLAKEQIERLMPYCLAEDPEYRGCMALHSIMLAALHADQKFEAKERALMLQLLGPQDVDCYGKLMSEAEAEKRALAVLKNHPEAREPALLLCIAISAGDETITLREREFIHKFLFGEKNNGKD